MKRFIVILCLFLLTITLCACENAEQKNDDVYSKIHSKYYTLGSYCADCAVTVYTTGGENTYECIVKYNSDEQSFQITSDDMDIKLTNDKTVISKNGNTIEAVPSDADMYIFVNTFFKSYYESEDTTVNVGKDKSSEVTLLECSSVNPNEFVSNMKLWIDNDSVLPVKMQLYNNNNQITSEILFRSFRFI